MSSEESLVEANTRFALDLLQKLNNEDNTGNIFYSPFSISTALAMVMLGAEGDTKKQISEVLHFGTPQGGNSQQQSGGEITIQEVSFGHENFAELLGKVNQPNRTYEMVTADRVYGEKTFTFHESFLVDTERYYKAQLEKVDFKEAAEAARIAINAWVAEQTKEKIKNLLDSGAVSSLTRMVLVNAIYFKGKWNSLFKEEDTKDAEFRMITTEKRTVKMMHQRSHFSFAHKEVERVKVLEMPYKENDLNMIIILPDDKEDGTALDKLVKGLTYEKFTELTREDLMVNVEVDVSLPKFKMGGSYDLNKVLTEMGMVNAFDASLSDFSGMSAVTDLAVSAVKHKAVVEVNEEGTEAAAATGVIIGVTSMEEPTEKFTADHPFLIFIKHKATKSVLFAGRYSNPDKE